MTLSNLAEMGNFVNVGGPLYARLFACPPAYDLIFACLSPRSLIRVALTCRAASAAVTQFKSRAFSINRHFSRHFTNPIAFRSLQARTNTLVSGSNALQFLDRTFYPGSDLDLYTHPGHSFEVAQFLVQVEGYHYVPRESQVGDWEAATTEGNWDGTERRVAQSAEGEHTYPKTGVKAVWTFSKKGVHRERLKVQVIEAVSSPLETILGFHSTCVMNFISSDAAYSLYPVATFETRCTLGMPSSRTCMRSEPIQKYVKRGWRFYFAPTPNNMAQPKRSPFFLEQARWVCDKHTWILPLDQTGVEQRPPLSPTSVPLTSDPVLYNGWWIRRRHEDDGGGYECHYYPLRTTLFRYNYAISNEALVFALREWAGLQGMYSHDRIPKEDWIWFDADIPDSVTRVME